jgi:hypothetical protein
MTYRLLNAMSSTLRKDICNTEKLEKRTDGVVKLMTNNTLSSIAYACEHWIDHLCESALTSPESPENVLLD